MATQYRSAILLVDTGYPSPSEIKKLRMKRAHVLSDVQGNIAPAIALVAGPILQLQRPEDTEPIGVPIQKSSILDYVRGRILASTIPITSANRLNITPAPRRGYESGKGSSDSRGA